MGDVDERFVVANLKAVRIRPRARSIALLVDTSIIVDYSMDCLADEPPGVSHIKTGTVRIANTASTQHMAG